ncbi:putative late blight resistance protein homolog R1A-10 [Salvia miltiorrhiza]|uniref:putative late blight resistance protein homolog R1A-10 n=1 Tax=Salvia miltiorrhiza TaxID=226208 RepID=UPI0025ACA734|nr:putative late blight resistance protein homolog R1A-10 [Salvia miltiorrhiza]XP_057801554.1 putative late blight resistance protein homolog R1A-10 [Salvia miltiorrhiza]XP_057801555.1 putative late blight resistance protein homolog R1A-10 [Salvia miltiorrhiza]
MAEAAVTFLLDNVQKLLVEQMHLISGAEKELKQLQIELELMNAFLMEYADKREKGRVFIQFERQIREAVYEAEDILDACLTQKAQSGATTIRNFMHLHDLAEKVNELRLQLQPIFDRAIKGLNALPIAHPSAATPDDNKFKKTQLLREDNVVGFADEEATLMKYLKEKTEQLDVISIVGMPGLGKTTLAWKIYRDPKIQFEFPTLIWVYVSQELNVREVFLTILKHFTRNDMSGKGEWELTQLVRSHLDKGRFLLFMDDVWSVEDWRRIEAALPKSNKLGKVLITSRHVGVATQTNCSRDPHKLRFMTFEESWELLQLEVFGKNNPSPKELEGLGMHIARQCGGVPLAVVVIGGTLVEKCDNKRDWEKISDSVSIYVQDDKRTESIISLSYNNLPHHLRDCFLYLGMFPEDTEISACKLTRLWIAEGFIQQRRGRSLEEVAEDNLDDLVARNLVMVERAKANGDVKTCRVHDMIREFCQNEASFANKNLFQEVKKRRHGVFDPAVTEIVKRRRLCIHSHVPEFLRRKPRGPGVRSFVCFSKETIALLPEYTPSIPDAFHLLRVVDATPLKFTKFPPKLTKLIHLRYIALSGNEFKALPEALSKLWNLQTVKIDTASRELEFKVDISKMMQLRHLKTKAAIKLKEARGEGGENLQTLSRLMAECCNEELFTRASNLKNLGIRGDLNALVDATYLGKLERLEKLKLVHDVFPSTADKALHRVPHSHGFPPNLRMLTLSSTYLGWQHMAALGRLLNLQVLKLKEMAFKGTLWEAQGGGFPQLETLHIERTELEIWTAASAEPFPKLKNLILKNCERLQEIPCVVGKGESLQLVDIERVSHTLLQSAKKIEVEKQQMQGGDVRGRRAGGFKLKISPGDASSSSSTTN